MARAAIKVYDFDKTVYMGDSMVDFYTYSVVRNPLLLRFLPAQLWHVFWFAVGREDRTTVKTNFFRYLRGIADPVAQAEQFWAKRFDHCMQPWFTSKDHTNDVILTASPEFLVAPLTNRLGVRLIGTKMDPRTGRIDGLNCYGQEKVRRLQQELPGITVAEAYGDRDSDLPVLALAQKAYLVKGAKVTELKR